MCGNLAAFPVKMRFVIDIFSSTVQLQITNSQFQMRQHGADPHFPVIIHWERIKRIVLFHMALLYYHQHCFLDFGSIIYLMVNLFDSVSMKEASVKILVQVTLTLEKVRFCIF